jgi:L-fuculose-phosphate aldolase
MRGLSELTPERIVAVDLDGRVLEGAERPPSEQFIHTRVYAARQDVGGIVHTHQTLATMFGVVGREILPILHVEAPLVARPIPIYPSPELIIDAELGDAVARALGAGPLVPPPQKGGSEGPDAPTA